MQRYNPKEIETKWQQWWDETSTYTADLDSRKPKYIAMSMFNYPSGAGIHIGHAMNYTISDVKARFKRQQGFESYHPVGWDAFGLPAENYAIKSGVSPQVSMAKIIPGYHKQYKAMGWSNDWEKEIATHTPEYYKWTQWIFVQMYKHGLAYQDSRLQWWCAKDNTVLANEQVIDGKCWRHDGPDDPPVEKREVKQWFFKITDYADELLAAIDDLDWTESVKLAQKNWIGKSEGAEVEFKVKDSDEVITVFTTRPDTLYGATFLVVAPEADVTKKIAAAATREAVESYIAVTAKKTEVERQADKVKTGVFTGAYALHPLTGQELPIWTADYVLAGYGTGAIMAVPAHDERDREFATAFNLPIVKVIEVAEGAEPTDDGRIINSGVYDGLSSAEGRRKIVADLAAKNSGRAKINYRMRDWSVSRQRYWGAPIPVINCPKCGPQVVSEDQLPVRLPEIDDFAPAGDGRSALARAKDWLNVECPKCLGPAERETDTMDTYVDSSWYMLRYFDPHNQQAIFDSERVKKWEPIDFYNGADHATAHLLYARFVARFFTKIGLINQPEPFKHFLFNGKVTAADGQMFSKSKGNGVDPLEIIDQGYGADALRTYLMFAAPLDLWARWDPQGVPGTHRFLSRLFNLVSDYTETSETTLDDNLNREILRASHSMVRKMTEDIEADRYNTAIAAAMTCVNDLYRLKRQAFGHNQSWQQALEQLVACIAPFAPHIAEELWQRLGHSSSVHIDTWPAYDEKLLQQDKLKIAVQVNGKLRSTIEIESEALQSDVETMARADERTAVHLKNAEIRKVVYVPGKIINFVTAAL